MRTQKLLKTLLSESYELENQLTDLIKQCFEEMFKQHAAYAFSLFEDDLQDGIQYNGCLQGLEYFKKQVEDTIKLTNELKVKHANDWKTEVEDE